MHQKSWSGAFRKTWLEYATSKAKEELQLCVNATVKTGVSNKHFASCMQPANMRCIAPNNFTKMSKYF